MSKPETTVTITTVDYPPKKIPKEEPGDEAPLEVHYSDFDPDEDEDDEAGFVSSISMC